MIQIFQNNEGELAKFSHLLKRIEVPAKTTLLKEGDIAKTTFFIESGGIRSWFNNAGNDVSFQFFFEGEMVSSIESYYTGLPSKFNLETIEPCVLQSITKDQLDSIFNESSILRKDMDDFFTKRLLHYQNLFLSRITKTPQERYEEFRLERPDILQRVPQHYIASYLGITPVSLSRIRNRR